MKSNILMSILIVLCFHHAVYGLSEKEIAETVNGLTEKEIAEKAKANIEKMNIKDLPETIKEHIVELTKSNLEKMNINDLPETIKVRVVMEIDDKNERIEREFDIISKRYEYHEAKTLISFIRPSNMKILAHVDKEGKQNIWMKMSSGKIRKISINLDEERSIPILADSHFTLEDLNMEALGSLGIDFNNLQDSLKNIDINEIEKKAEDQLQKIDFQYLGEKKVAGSECYMVASTLRETSKVKDIPYKKVIYYFQKSDFYPVRVDFFKRDALYKYLELYDVKEVDGLQIPIPFRIVMTMANGKDKTELKVRGIKFNAKISDSRFNKSSL